MTTYQMRPMSIGEILDAAFTIYRRQFGIFMGIGVAGYGMGSVLLTYIALSGGYLEHLGLSAIAYVVLSVGALVATGASVRVISETYLGEKPALGPALSYALGRMWPLLVANSIVFLFVAAGFVALIVPGIIAALASCVVSQVIVLERPESSVAALPRSWTLTKSHRLRALALILVATMLLIIPISALGIAAAIVPTFEPAAQVLTELVRVSTYPVLPTVLTLYYYDLRVRKEAFDLQVLSRQLSPNAPA
ncbi:MAG TPA: hypothetical protein VGI83_02330 [Gemmatimonadales bacterium]|jgi:hypothetical protein